MIWLVNYFIYMNNIISLYFHPRPKFFYTKNKKFNDSDSKNKLSAGHWVQKWGFCPTFISTFRFHKVVMFPKRVIIGLYFHPRPKFFYTKNKKFNDSDSKNKLSAGHWVQKWGFCPTFIRTLRFHKMVMFPKRAHIIVLWPPN